MIHIQFCVVLMEHADSRCYLKWLGRKCATPPHNQCFMKRHTMFWLVCNKHLKKKSAKFMSFRHKQYHLNFCTAFHLSNFKRLLYSVRFDDLYTTYHRNGSFMISKFFLTFPKVVSEAIRTINWTRVSAWTPQKDIMSGKAKTRRSGGYLNKPKIPTMGGLQSGPQKVM